MKLGEILEGTEVRTSQGDWSSVCVTSVESVSSACGIGSVFFCLRGSKYDGHAFVRDATDHGASALVVEHLVDSELPQVVVQPGSIRGVFAVASSNFWGRPAEQLRMFAVTGTNGKTTVTHMIAAILGSSGIRTSVLGTLSGSMTTPDANVLHAWLSARLDDGDKAVAMEVSSHGISGNRIEAIKFELAIFTNLGHDHLDFHGTMESYYQAKAALFTPERAEIGLICVDTSWGQRLAAEASIPVFTYSTDQASHIEGTFDATSFRYEGRTVKIPMIGKFNVTNAIAALSVGRILSLDAIRVQAGLEQMAPIRGRMERVTQGAGPEVFVDFAHTPDALDSVLTELKERSKNGRVIVVFGCGGDRDKSKRPDMGSIAGSKSDVAYVTSDNPRSEAAVQIIGEILSGIDPGSKCQVVAEPDRRIAIMSAVSNADPDDVVLIAGKGHETGQIIDNHIFEFDDAEVAREAIASAFQKAPPN